MLNPSWLLQRSFEGRLQTQSYRQYPVNVTVCGQSNQIQVMEWPLVQDFYGILGQSWLKTANPVIDWCQRQIQFRANQCAQVVVEHAPASSEIERIDLVDIKRNLDTGAYSEVYHLDVVRIEDSELLCDEIHALVKEFGDCLREVLPDGLSPERDVEHSLNMKPEAKPSFRAPFRHSHIKQQAVKDFVQQWLKKQWIERISSPWVLNIFVVPKRDPITGELQSKIQWARNCDPSKPVQWVIDYRYVNSCTDVPRIPIPRIDEFFYRLAGFGV